MTASKDKDDKDVGKLPAPGTVKLPNLFRQAMEANKELVKTEEEAREQRKIFVQNLLVCKGRQG